MNATYSVAAKGTIGLNRMEKSRFPYKRIAVIGTAGAGKSKFAKILAERLDIPHIELDALYWEPDWTPADLVDFRDRVASATDSAGWIADGNYRTSRDVVWGRAEALV